MSRVSLKGMYMLDFVVRNCDQFSVNTIKLLYCSMVRSNLQYATIIWFPYYQSHIEMIERVQAKCLRFAVYKFGIRMEDYHRALHRADVLRYLKLPHLNLEE